jgi:hypothetical protein
MQEPEELARRPGLVRITGEALAVAGLIVAMAYAVPIGFELIQL